MAKSVQDILTLIKEKGIKMVDFKMVDINGQYRHVTIPAENFSEEVMTYGIGFDASNYGYAVVEKSDMVFKILSSPLRLTLVAVRRERKSFSPLLSSVSPST